MQENPYSNGFITVSVADYIRKYFPKTEWAY